MLAELTPDGRIVNQGSYDLVQSFYKKVIQDIIILIDKTSMTLGYAPKSVYVRGSVATGRAIEGLSDIDLVVIYDELSGKEKAAHQKIADKISLKYRGRVDEVDITVLSLPALLYDEPIKNLKIYLKYQSVLLIGEDILGSLPEVYPGSELALFMYGDIKSEFISLENQFRKLGPPKVYQNVERSTRFWCVWMARTTLRSGMALSMSKEAILTQDLLECRDICVKHFPELKEMMEVAVNWAIEPTDDESKCIDFIETYRDNYIKLWTTLRETSNKKYE